MTPRERLDAIEARNRAVDAEYAQGGGGEWGVVHESQGDVPDLVAFARAVLDAAEASGAYRVVTKHTIQRLAAEHLGAER